MSSSGDVWINLAGSYDVPKIALDLVGRKIYWVSQTDSSIYRADLDTGANIEVFLGSLGSTPLGIAIPQ